MAYKLLSLTAISGEFPTDQLNRLPGSPYYLESVVTALKKTGCCVPITGINCAATVWGREPKPLYWIADRTGLPAT